MSDVQVQLTARERLANRKKELEGFFTKKRFGQNFLISDRVIRAIVSEAKNQKPGSLIEIGPGLGALTDLLSQLEVPFSLIELDPELVQFWRGKGFNTLHEDALYYDWHSLSSARPRVLVSNLPYQISSRLVIDRSLDPDPLAVMILMFQKEVAAKILSKAPSAETGFLSVMAQAFWRVRSLVKAAPGDFQPAPKVSSQVLVFNSVMPPPVVDKKQFFEFLKLGFSAPRKVLASNLKQGFDPRSIAEAFEKLGFHEKIRAHEVSVTNWITLHESLEKRIL